MPRTLVNEFIERRKDGDKFGSSLKNAIFQARSRPIDDYDEEQGKMKFQLWKIHMRGISDDDPVEWWFACTAVPLLAATLGPLTNVLSIGALVTSWRVNLVDPANPKGPQLTQLTGNPIHDPKWCYWINVVSLLLGFIGNCFQLLHFANRVRYIVALPISILLWFLACGFLIGDLAAMNTHAAPVAPNETYSEGLWYGVAAATMYLILSMLLLVNFIGYVRGHYPQHFELTEHQRTLIVQTMGYFIWLAGGAGVFARIEGWQFVNALYYCDVTILTIGFGDLYPQTNLGRALVIPYSIIGIIMLGLVISSIFRSVSELGERNIVRRHYEKERERTVDRTVTTSLELERKEIELELARERQRAKAAAHSSARSPATVNAASRKNFFQGLERSRTREGSSTHSRTGSLSSELHSSVKKKEHILLLREEKERFEAMRKIQKSATTWKHWWHLSIAFTFFAFFWLVGAVVFWQAEKSTSTMTYWQTVYFCWVSLLTIGYGDFSPKSGAGRCFFVIWSFIAVPTMTILASHLTSTVVAVFNSFSVALADFTILSRDGTWRDLVKKSQELVSTLQQLLVRLLDHWRETGSSSSNGYMEHEKKPPILRRAATSPDVVKLREDMYAAGLASPDIDAIEKQHQRDLEGKHPDAAALARQLALAIRRAAVDMSQESPRQYSYEEWVEFTRLIRFSAIGATEALAENGDEGMIHWDWLAENSPMMATQSEPQFVLERLCESLVRYLRRNPPQESFAGTLKEQGETALRLRGSNSEVPPVLVTLSTPRAIPKGSKTGSKAVSKATPKAGPSSPKVSDVAPLGLHPVLEEGH